MTLNPMKSPAFFSLLSAWLVLLVASIFPIWEITFPVRAGLGGPYQVTEPNSLWDVMRDRPYALGPKSIVPGLLIEDLQNLGLGFVILACGAGIGRYTYWCVWQRERVAAGP
jgi:hypothetical protein